MIRHSIMRQFFLSLAAILIGWLLIFAMTIHVLRPSFAVSAIGYALTLLGLVGGVDALVRYVQERRR